MVKEFENTTICFLDLWSRKLWAGKSQYYRDSIVLEKLRFQNALLRIRTGPRKPGKSWNFIMAFSRTGKSWKNATGPGKLWKSVNSTKKY